MAVKKKSATVHRVGNPGYAKLRLKEKTVLKSLGQCSFTANSDPSAVDVKDGRIIRVRPHHYDEKYTREEINPWKIEKNGRVYEVPLKNLIAPYQLAYKKRVYSPNRIKYPLKRVDWDPAGERHTENRGKSPYQRISWEEATSLVAAEIKRVRTAYGPYAVLCQGDGHGETKTIHGPHACQMLLMEMIGGYTLTVRNPDSWEGWYWGTEHMWGGWLDCGHMRPTDNLLNDITQHSELIVHIGADLETNTWGFGSQFPTGILYYWTGIGKQQIFISPDLNYAAAVHADKWIPILPNTDAALLLAIANIWINEGTFDKAYVATHVVGFDKFSDYVMGREDGVPKTAEWASAKCGVPEWTIKALAREWGRKTASTIHYYGGSYIRGPYSHEPARLEACLLGMQGLGKPGVHQYTKIMGGDHAPMPDTPRPVKSVGSEFQKAIWPGFLQLFSKSRQLIPKTLVHQAILNPPLTFWGSTGQFIKTEDQFKKYTYPIPAEEGGSEFHMIWMDNPCRTTCWNGGYRTVDAFRSPKIECIVVQHPWMENDTVMADIILPTNTKFEEEDIAELHKSPLKGLAIEERAIEPIGESLSDYEAVAEVARKFGLYQEYTRGTTVREKIKLGFENSGLTDLITWEKFNANKYFITPTAADWQKDPPGLRPFYEDPIKHPLETPTGKLEFYSQKLAEAFPDDQERPPSPRWIEKGPSHDERLSSPRAQKYPLLLLTNHPRWRTHAQSDDISWLREIPTCKVKGWDGYMYEPVWIHPRDAAARGIQSGDIVKLFNERGVVLGAAIVWERIMPGVVSQDHGARADMIAAGPEIYLDRGGANNLISPENGTSQNCWGQATSGYLLEVQKVTMAEMEGWKIKYPASFAREYDPASGLRFNAWVVVGKKEAGR
ncbi:MAG: molybdopterin oxidoreductase [Chloroflexi bacterium]|nr:molybdopterin oxidoreductase [Chloroflexota bacterium]